MIQDPGFWKRRSITAGTCFLFPIPLAYLEQVPMTGVYVCVWFVQGWTHTHTYTHTHTHIHTMCVHTLVYTYAHIHTPLGRSHAPGLTNQHFADETSWVPVFRAQNNLNAVLIPDFSVIEVNIFSLIFKSVCIEFSVTFNQRTLTNRENKFFFKVNIGLPLRAVWKI